MNKNNLFNQRSRNDVQDTRDQDIKFVKRFSSNLSDNEKEGLVYAPPKNLSKFYQVCSFKNPETQMYDVRIVMFNEHSEVVKQEEYMYDERHCNMLIKSKKSNRIKIYPTFSIDMVDLPDMDDLLRCQSSLLN